MIINIQDVKANSKVFPDDDSLIIIKMNAAIEYVIRFLGYDPSKKDYITKLMGNNSGTLYLESYPINGLININGIEYSDFTTFKNIVKIPNLKLDFNTIYTVSYNAGYDTVPESIYDAMLQIASLRVKEIGRIGTSKISDPTGSAEFISFTNFDRYTNNIKNLKLMKEIV